MFFLFVVFYIASKIMTKPTIVNHNNILLFFSLSAFFLFELYTTNLSKCLKLIPLLIMISFFIKIIKNQKNKESHKAIFITT